MCTGDMNSRKNVHSFDLCTQMNSFGSIQSDADMTQFRLLQNKTEISYSDTPKSDMPKSDMPKSDTFLKKSRNSDKKKNLEF